MNAYPTGWGWLTTASGLALVPVFVVWRLRYRGKRRVAGIFIVLVLLFLFSFMQWASWYK